MAVAMADTAMLDMTHETTHDIMHNGARAGGLPARRVVVLARTSCENGGSRAEIARDLSFLTSGGATRIVLDIELAALVRSGLVVEDRSRFTGSDEGLAALGAELGCKITAKTSWSDLRDHRLVGRALGLDRASAARLKGLADADQLRAEILGGRFGFKLRGAVSAARLRSDLALVALERAFGNTMKGAFTARNGLNAKAARLLAGQLLAKPRDVGTDSRLIALLAAESVGATKVDADALRLALLRRFAGPVENSGQQSSTAREQTTNAIVDAAPAKAVVADAKPPAASRPGLEGFASAVNAAAGTVAEGWPGNRKALVSRVWRAIEANHAAWGLSEIEFKAMLAEAHRTGHLVLATADLKDKRQLRELQASAIAYKNTVWHLVRVQD